tara:strand:- start:287 stop:895 length:609 start_codon:yes stop_codon:yes gene_type:complete
MKILTEINKYYTDKVIAHGATSEGVDWNSKESHFLRFEQLSKVLPEDLNFSLMDYGCGFGFLIEFLVENNFKFNYSGYDISEEMIIKAKSIYSSKNISFDSKLNANKYEYTIANGVFNVKLDSTDQSWQKYIEETLNKINEISEKGFSFNILTSYSDEEYKKDYLYYADSLYFFDFCKRNFSKNVALLHDYELYEFTIIVKK